jgi:hypothetical protein
MFAQKRIETTTRRLVGVGGLGVGMQRRHSGHLQPKFADATSFHVFKDDEQKFLGKYVSWSYSFGIANFTPLGRLFLQF